MLQFLHQMFNMFALLLDDPLKPETPLIAPLLSGVACLSASSSSKDTLNICCKNCRMMSWVICFFIVLSLLGYLFFQLLIVAISHRHGKALIPLQISHYV